MKVLFLMGLLVSHLPAFAQPQILTQLVYEIRDPKTSPAAFREALGKIGEYLALNVLEDLNTKETKIRTLTDGEATHHLVTEEPVLITILRAGLPLNNGVHRVFPNAEVGFLAMSRNEETLKAQVDYIGIPDLKERTVILTDTMLATGGSLVDALQILKHYQPKRIFLIVAIASEPGIAKVLQFDPTIKIFAGAIDPTLNHKGYIVPGLGDAGDRSFGMKCAVDALKRIPKP